MNNLPINGRRWFNFALMTPGTVTDGGFGDVSFRGISGLLNNNTVDGGDNNQAFFAEEKGRTRIAYSTSQQSIQEFQVNTSAYSAEYGRAAGGVINAVTKSGTNQFHGGLFYYNRDQSFGAYVPFATQPAPGERLVHARFRSSRSISASSSAAMSAATSSRTSCSSTSTTTTRCATSRQWPRPRTPRLCSAR